jgi:predicted XRE-type DNA-binding protein
MIDPKDVAIRATLTEKMARMLKRRAYTERQIVQVLRVVPDKAKAILEGRLDQFSHDEIRRFIAQLD